MNRVLAVLLIVGFWTLGGAIVHAQTTSPKERTTRVISDQDLNLLRKDLRSKRKQLIAANLTLTDSEAAKFWPVYDQYMTELIGINDKKFTLIQNYADNWGKLNDEHSLSFIRQWTDADIAVTQLRQKYVAIVSKVLDGKKTATFMQLDRRHRHDDRAAGGIANATGTGPRPVIQIGNAAEHRSKHLLKWPTSSYTYWPYCRSAGIKPRWNVDDRDVREESVKQCIVARLKSY